MELKITAKKQEPLLSRSKVDAEVSFEKSTPSKLEIKSRLVKDLGIDENLVVVKGVYNDYGLRNAKIISYTYENADVLKRIEPKPRSQKEKKEGKEEKNATKEKQADKK